MSVKNKKTQWVAWKTREIYPMTQNEYWVQHLKGPLYNPDANELYSNLKEVKTQTKDVKDIRIFIET